MVILLGTFVSGLIPSRRVGSTPALLLGHKLDPESSLAGEFLPSLTPIPKTRAAILKKTHRVQAQAIHFHFRRKQSSFGTRRLL